MIGVVKIFMNDLMKATPTSDQEQNANLTCTNGAIK